MMMKVAWGLPRYHFGMAEISPVVDTVIAAAARPPIVMIGSIYVDGIAIWVVD